MDLHSRMTGKAAALLLAFTFVFQSCPTRAEPSSKVEETYYVSLGDSMAIGAQQDPETGMAYESNQGYTDQLYRLLRKTNPKLKHVRLGCGGETSTSMISGGVCTYAAGSQLEEAVRFIRKNRSRIVALTLNIGSNDIGSTNCLVIADPTERNACVQQTLQVLGGNLAYSLQALVAASENAFPIVGANINNKYLNSWLSGPQGQYLAMATAQLEQVLNGQVLEPIYAALGIRVARLTDVFHSQDFTTLVASDFPPPNDVLPLNVAMVCRYTSACPRPESGLTVDYHFNTEGYGLVAREFLAAMHR